MLSSPGSRHLVGGPATAVAVLLAAHGLHAGGPATGPRWVSSQVKSVRLDPPPEKGLSSFVKGGQLVLADLGAGKVRVYDTATGLATSTIGRSGLKPGELVKPIHAFAAGSEIGVWNYRSTFQRGFLIFAAGTSVGKEIPAFYADGSFLSPTLPPHWDKGRILAIASMGKGQKVPPDGKSAIIFALDTAGHATAVAWAEDAAEAHQMGRGLKNTLGGIASLPDGGWVAVLPGTYEFFRFDRMDRLVRRWHGDRAHFTAADWSTRSRNEDDDLMWQWYRTLTFVSAPVLISDKEIGVIVGPVEPGGRSRSLWLEVYDTSNGSAQGSVRLPLDPLVQADECLAASDVPGDIALVISEDGQRRSSPVTLARLRVQAAAAGLQSFSAAPGSK